MRTEVHLTEIVAHISMADSSSSSRPSLPPPLHRRFCGGQEANLSERPSGHVVLARMQARDA